MGGAYLADKAHSALYREPGQREPLADPRARGRPLEPQGIGARVKVAARDQEGSALPLPHRGQRRQLRRVAAPAGDRPRRRNPHHVGRDLLAGHGIDPDGSWASGRSPLSRPRGRRYRRGRPGTSSSTGHRFLDSAVDGDAPRPWCSPNGATRETGPPRPRRPREWGPRPGGCGSGIPRSAPRRRRPSCAARCSMRRRISGVSTKSALK